MSSCGGLEVHAAAPCRSWQGPPTATITRGSKAWMCKRRLAVRPVLRLENASSGFESPANGSSYNKDYIAPELFAQDGPKTNATVLELLEAIKEVNRLQQKVCKLLEPDLNRGKAPQLIQAANALMQHNAYPNEQELSRALNDAIGGSNDEQCIRLAGGFTMWKSLRSQFRRMTSNVRTHTSRRVRAAVPLMYAGVFKDGALMPNKAAQLVQGSAYRARGTNQYSDIRFQAVLSDAYSSRVPKGNSANVISWLGPGGVAYVDNLVHWLLLGNRTAAHAMYGKSKLDKYVVGYDDALKRARSLAEGMTNTPAM